MGLRVAYPGESYNVLYGLSRRGEALAEEFLETFDPASYDSMMLRIRWHGDHGPSLLKSQYEQVVNHPGIYELKAMKNRLLGFELEAHDLVLTNGYKKSAPRKEIERAYEKAEGIRDDISEEMKHGERGNERANPNER